MYKEYFGFIKEPFNITPDPHFFYCSKNHEEILNVIEYQLKKRRGYIVLVGEVGTGKTLICKTLLNRLVNYDISYIMNPFLSENEILVKICNDFGIKVNPNDKKSELFEKLNDFLVKNYNEEKNAVIVVDEAQNLSYDSFEILRHISNIELDNAKLVQIILVGQQELIDKLNSPELRQLNQRISTILELKPLSKEETENYINFRLQESLKYKRYLFTKSAINLIYKYTNGIPREINQLAEIALLVAYSKNKKKVTKSDIIEAAKEYYNKKKKSYKDKKLFLKFLFSISILIILFFIFFLYKNKRFINNYPVKTTVKIKVNRKAKSKSDSEKAIAYNKSINTNAIKNNQTDDSSKQDNESKNILKSENSSIQKIIIDNNTLKKNIFYEVFIGPVEKKVKNFYYKILAKNKIDCYIVKLKKKRKYIIHIAFFKNYDNVKKLKQKLKKLGLKDIVIKKIEK